MCSELRTDNHQLRIGDEQFGFIPGRVTTDAIFETSQVIDKHRVMQKELHMLFIDLDKT